MRQRKPAITYQINDLHQENLNEFLAFAIERYRVMLKKASGDPPPWTSEDEPFPELNHWFFCNVFREDDKTTRWFKENIREPLHDEPRVLNAVIVFRSFNLIETGEALKQCILDDENCWPAEDAREILNQRLAEGRQIVTGAYMVPTRPGMSKVDSICDRLDHITSDAIKLVPRIKPGQTTLQGLWKVLTAYPGVGSFTGYEYITDLRHTYLLENAPDINSWAAPGPGAMRGLGRIIRDQHFMFGKNAGSSMAHWTTVIPLMQKLMDWVNQRWPSEWPRWEMREVEHWLCEYSKLKHGRDGGNMKRNYLPGGASGSSSTRKTSYGDSPGALGAGDII